MTELEILDLPAELDGIVEYRDGVPTLLAQMLARIAGGDRAGPIACATRLDRALRQLCEQLDANATQGTHSGFAIDFGPLANDDASAAPPPGETAVSADLRITAMRHARTVWNHALAGIVSRHIDQRSHGRWNIRTKGQWRQYTPHEHQLIDQGWKIHVSATPNNAPLVLAACVDLLLSERVPFKHAAKLEHVESLNSSKCDRGNGGKFITVYPNDPQQARRLIVALDDATRDFVGPEILSDQCYRDGGLVYYRYGVFNAEAALSNDGSYEARLIAPDGSRRSDLRKAWFAPPSWVEPLFPQATRGDAAQPQSVLINQRYRVTGAIRHANRGGVYRAIDETTGRAVIIKQARPHTASEVCGYDAIAALRKEAGNLLLLHGLSAEFVELFEQQHLFLVQGAIDGCTLRKWIVDRCETSLDAGPALTRDALRALAIATSEMLVAVHARGVVCRDFTPNNLMVETEGRLRLIDLELVERPGNFISRYYTYGFGAPELLGSERFSACPDASVDAYSLGAMLFFIASGRMPPVFLSNDTPASLQMRWQICNDALRSSGLAGYARLIESLVQFEPGKRISALDALQQLHNDATWHSSDAVASAGIAATCVARPTAAQLLLAGNEYILQRRDTAAARLWPSGKFGSSTDECNVQHGAGGVLGYLNEISAAHRPHTTDQAMREIADWIDTRLAARERLLPGLYFGAAGAALACLRTADRLGHPSLRERALERLLALPVEWPNPDICHGAAGAGLALCEAWQQTRDQRLLEHIDRCADHLLASVRHHGGGVHWTVAEDFESALKGVSHYGFAHGLAGIAYFLLVAGIVRCRADCVDLAVRAGHTLVDAAERGVWGARWRASVARSANSAGELYYHWCNGSSGIGSFLIRLWYVTGIGRFADCADEAARAVHRIRWHSGTTGCHGVAGNGEFLLDMAQLRDPAYQDLALDMVDCLRVKSSDQHGSHLIVDENETAVTVDFNTGLSGALAFLERAQRGGDRMWMADAVVRAARGAFA